MGLSLSLRTGLAPGSSGFPDWLLPQVPGNGIQYEFTRGQYWLGSGLTAWSNVLADTRNSDALFDNTAGVYKLFGPNVPAITDRGLYPGGQRTNLIPYSRDFDSWVPQGAAAVSADAATAPDGTVTADKLYIPTVETNTCQVTTNVTAANSTVYTYSVFAKMDGARWCSIALQSAFVSNGRAWFDLQSGVVGTKQAGLTSSSITAYADGWYRISVTFTSLGTAAGSRSVYVTAVGADNATTLTSDGTNGQLLWGADLVTSAFASPPIVTEGAAATRLADSIVNPNFAAHAAAFGFASGMAALARVNLTRLGDGAARRITTFGTAADGAYIEFTTANTFKAVLRKASADAVTLTSGTVSATGVYDVTAQFEAGSYSLTVSDGIAGAASASAETLPAAIASAAYIGQSASTTLHTESPLERLAMWGV